MSIGINLTNPTLFNPPESYNGELPEYESYEGCLITKTSRADVSLDGILGLSSGITGELQWGIASLPNQAMQAVSKPVTLSTRVLGSVFSKNRVGSLKLANGKVLKITNVAKERERINELVEWYRTLRSSQ